MLPLHIFAKTSENIEVVEKIPTQSRYDDLVIKTNSSQEFVLSNGNSTHYTGETKKLETRKWHGLVHRDINYLTNIWFSVQGTVLSQNDIVLFSQYPSRVVIEYENNYHEEIFMADNLDALSYSLYAPDKETLGIQPSFAMRIDYYAGSSISDYDYSWEENVLYVKTQNSKYVALVFSESMSFDQNARMVDREFAKDDLRNDGSSTENLFVPGTLTTPDVDRIRVVAGLGETKLSAQIQAKNLLDNYSELLNQKNMRLKQLVDTFNIDGEFSSPTDLPVFESMAWTKISIDKLRMKRFGEGLYAGYHWFDTYWGRDTFISYEGAILAQGDWDFAKKGIRTMAELQSNDSNAYHFGRVPNLISREDTSPDYSTADGTGWFSYAVRKYLQLSQDRGFALEIFPHIELALRGELSRLDDSTGFVTHLDRETWMDAQTGSVIHTPRGVSAVEIQALLYQIYTTFYFLLQYTGKSSPLGSASEIKQDMDTLEQNILKEYYNGGAGLFYDHINEDRTKDTQRRANQFLALRLLSSDLIDKDELSSLLEHNSDLIANHGIRTLTPSDPNYKPTHDQGGWHHDSAYHNGDVWPWLSGSIIDLTNRAGEYSTSTQLLMVLLEHSLLKNPVGGIGEVFNGNAAGSGESVGALFQLWSMAEYMRAMTFGLTGYVIDPTGSTLILRPEGMNYMDSFEIDLPNADQKTTIAFNKADMVLNISNVDNHEHLRLVLPKSYNDYFVYVNDELLPLDTKTLYRDTIEYEFKNSYHSIKIQFSKEKITSNPSGSMVSSQSETFYSILPTLALLPYLSNLPSGKKREAWNT